MKIAELRATFMIIFIRKDDRCRLLIHFNDN